MQEFSAISYLISPLIFLLRLVLLGFAGGLGYGLAYRHSVADVSDGSFLRCIDGKWRYGLFNGSDGKTKKLSVRLGPLYCAGRNREELRPV